MEKQQYDELAALPDWKLMEFMTERNHSERAHAAGHLLQMRRNKVMERTAMYSAIATLLAALVAVIQLFK